MAEDFKLIYLERATKELGLDRHFRGRATLDQYVTARDRIRQIEGTPEQLKRIESKNPDWRDTIRSNTPIDYFVRHYDNHAVIAGDLDMDALPGQGDIAGIVVDGDLELNGSILNWEIDTNAAFLWVRGNLHCDNIVFGCMDLVVSGNVTAANLIVATYNHGLLHIDGDVYAKTVIIDDDGSSTIDGKVYARGWNASQNADVRLRRSGWIDEVKPEFRNEFFDREGYVKCGDGNVDLVKALLAGRDILRPER